MYTVQYDTVQYMIRIMIRIMILDTERESVAQSIIQRILLSTRHKLHCGDPSAFWWTACPRLDAAALTASSLRAQRATHCTNQWELLVS